MVTVSRGDLPGGQRDAASTTICAIFVDQITDVPSKLCSCSSDPFPVRDSVKSLFQGRMLLNVSSQLLEGLSSLFQHAVEFSASLGFSFCQRHLHPAVCVDLSFT